MGIEVRQLTIKSSVADDSGDEADAPATVSMEDFERLKEDLLAECKSWMMEKLREARER